MLHRHHTHNEAVARIGWCVDRTSPRRDHRRGRRRQDRRRARRPGRSGRQPAHTIIYLGNPAIGARGLYAGIVTALGGVPRFHKAASSRRPAICSPPKNTNAAGPSS